VEEEEDPLLVVVAVEDLVVVEVPILVLLDLEILRQLYQDRDIRVGLEVLLDLTHLVAAAVPEVQVVPAALHRLEVLGALEELIPISHPLLLGGQYQQQFFQVGIP
jgi:hypothetical protein